MLACNACFCLQLLAHLSKLGADGGEGCLQSWPIDGPSVITVFKKILMQLEKEVSQSPDNPVLCLTLETLKPQIIDVGTLSIDQQDQWQLKTSNFDASSSDLIPIFKRQSGSSSDYRMQAEDL